MPVHAHCTVRPFLCCLRCRAFAAVLAPTSEPSDCMGKKQKKDSVLEDDMYMYEVEYIKARRLVRGQPEYLIKWEGLRRGQVRHVGGAGESQRPRARSRCLRKQAEEGAGRVREAAGGAQGGKGGIRQRWRTLTLILALALALTLTVTLTLTRLLALRPRAQRLRRTTRRESDRIVPLQVWSKSSPGIWRFPPTHRRDLSDPSR